MEKSINEFENFELDSTIDKYIVSSIILIKEGK
jgi:hypothetical protein